MNLAALGGVFAVLAFNHFFVDWIFQSHDAAMRKSSEWLVRWTHCNVYAAGFLPVLIISGIGGDRALVALSILFISHFIEDTYYPVYLWAKYIRRVPEIVNGDPKAAFAAWVKTPLGLVLAVAVDQIIHLAFLWPVAFLICSK